MGKFITFLIIIAIIIGGIYWYKGRSSSSTDNTNTPVQSTGENTLPQESSTSTASTTSAVKEFTIEAAPNFRFSPNTMTVNKGDTVKITFKNPTSMLHDLKIDEFNAATQRLSTGQSQTITFVADKAGTFEYYCSVGNHRAMGMVGTLTVR